MTHEQWLDFVARLRSDNYGEGVNYHHTAHPIFEVQEKQLITGLSSEYSDMPLLLDSEGSQWEPQEYWDEQEAATKHEINGLALEEHDVLFSDLSRVNQMEILEQHNSDLTMTYGREQWVHVTTHLTYQGAENFIKRKGHDYKELRIIVESLHSSYEFKDLIEAIINGQVTWVNSQGGGL